MLFQEDKACLSKGKQKVLSPLSEDEIDQLLKGHATTQAKANRQCAHGHESVGETSSSFENDDSLIISFIDQQTDNDNPAVISYEDHPPYCLTTEDHSIQDYFSDSSYVSCAEMFFQEEICSSICSEIFEAHEHIFTEEHDEGKSKFEAKDTLFFQQEVAVANLHIFHDPLASLLQPAVTVFIAMFSDEGDHGQLCLWMPSDRYLLLLMRSNQENQSRRHLLDWLHWHFDIV